MVRKTAWHPAFQGALGVELRKEQRFAHMVPECLLGKEPLRIDLLLIKRDPLYQFQNEIGHLWRKYNIIEYKGPDDSLTIDAFYKVIGYACLYKGCGQRVNCISAEEITVSVFVTRYPVKLFKQLSAIGVTAGEQYPGIYYLLGKIPFPMQIIVTGKLSQSAHSGLRILSKRVQKEDVRRFLEETKELTEQGDCDNVDAVLQASAGANYAAFEEIRRDEDMCEALRRLFQDEIEEKMATAKAEGKAEGEAKGEARGIAKAEAGFVYKLYMKGQTPEQIAMLTDKPEADIRRIIAGKGMQTAMQY